uniref:J domain-containing protein n=1 Tax=Glossina brevipalpis TaxID=37001 RepID=A0A1A9WRY1_9MUSC
MVLSLPELLLLGGERKLTACVLLLLLELFLEGAEAETSAADIENHLELGKRFLANNQLSDALTHYHAAVEGDPSNYLTLFKRGTIYLALGKTRFAIQDFSEVLELKPDFTAARVQRGSVYMKSGEFSKAAKDFESALELEPYNDAIKESQSRLDPAHKQWHMVQEIMEDGNYRNAIPLLTQLLEIAPWSIPFRKARSDAYIQIDDLEDAISDLRSVNRLSQDSVDGYYQLAKLLYRIGHVHVALKEIRECLKLDPEHKDCFPFYKKLRKVEKSLTSAEQFRDEEQYGSCINSAEMVLKHEEDETMVIFEAKSLLCSCYVRDEQYTKAISHCKEALNILRDAQVYCDRAEAYIGTELYDDAIRDFQEALNIDNSLQRAKDGMEKAKRLQRQAERRDYYKILGVKRNASKQEITKAYRKAAQKWHPDNFQGEEKKVAEKKFIDIAAAKEVLTDPQKRRQFDNGQDPLDPEGQQGGFHGGQPFAHFHHGSPFQYKFHFN